MKNLFLLPALLAGLGLIPAGRATAQTFTTLHSFTAVPSSPPYVNSDGASPQGGLILSGNTLYGTAGGGGSSGYGTVFAVNTNGTGFTNLHSFIGGSDGATPFAGLILSNNTLFGTAVNAGSSGYGMVFAVNTGGTGFTNMHSFTGGSDGAYPNAGLILSGNTLYGTANYGGGLGFGTVFAVKTNGTGFTNLHSFTGGSDGANPVAELILLGNTLYGTTVGGGSSGQGTVFAINTDSAGFTNLHSFTATTGPSPSTNSDGALPYAGLILSGNTLYGTAGRGGGSGNGTVFVVNTDGTGFTNLHSFTATTGPSPSTNSDGANVQARLILSGSTLYGTARGGGSSGNGTVFAVNTDGTGFTNLHSFTGGSDGANPIAELILSANTLYGTAYTGTSAGNGTVFSLSLGTVGAPQLTIIRSAANVVLTWPANAAGFTLQSTANLSPAIWNSVSPGPVVVNGQSTVTNPISGRQQFYRLRQ